ncbi:MAG: hypothetical protein A2087_00100 [Spirochaetes bacterium GWD1_61_31]|nr:MAG: hypothetical protein A2Y37_06775 [Spirochaetes bacterium GWB1_60_80]OHD30779.1 MAG: hypothetical protein A2004_04300 [Spirochaetes bacterium GWC1_61_12]OHD42948.1 MAG: hypothetical protein A2087_00100 [Spirochaetes bacterium GWD1_61_31]OHD46278.1 MAG: hypothetical protein A2Y35_07050 [Spirochaetes bacterium GWE1_60_18]OHD60885.1 MAG: hypothetical protein A2Y32_11795 [Spirochaetes bacterium GWF1_60_12]HCQ86289.1 hypothetical protein [Spirochaetaceae bacterium]
MGRITSIWLASPARRLYYAWLAGEPAIDFPGKEPVGLRILAQRKRAASGKLVRIEGHTFCMARLTSRFYAAGR